MFGCMLFNTMHPILDDICLFSRNIPHGLYRPFSPPGGGDVSNCIENDVQVKRQSENVENTEISASVLRHSYSQDYSQMGFKSRALFGKGCHGEFKSKTIRNIRLRPRQILCSKCKLTCTESNLKPVTKIENRIHRPQMMMPSRSSKIDTRKQSSALYTAESKPANKLIRIQKPIVTRSSKLLAKKTIKQIGLPDTKQHKPAKRLKVVAKRLLIPNKSKSNVKVEPKRKEKSDLEIPSILNLCDPSSEDTILVVVHDLTSETDCVGKNSTVAQMEAANADRIDNTVVNKLIRNEKSAVAKVSPVIKISIGDGAVLKIPPRLHSDEALLNDSSETEDLPEEGILDTPPVLEPIESTACQEITMEIPANGNYSWQKKLRKAWKKEKDREKQKPYPDLQSENKTTGNVHHHRKHKRKHKHRHNHPESNPTRQDDLMTENNNDDVVKINASDDENVIEISPDITEVITQRPRLLYTWHQQKGLSRVETNGNEMLEPEGESKSLSDDFKLHTGRDSGSSIWDSSIEFNSNSGCSSTSDGVKSSLGDDIIGNNDDASDGSLSEENESPPHGEGMEVIRPLMMRIQTRDVSKCIANDGRYIHVGDIVWGKIQGFPWWPGRVLTISVSQRDNGLVITQVAQVSWFGSSTMSHMQCTELQPFLEDFNLRYNRKKRGAYKMAIKQATVAAQSLHGTNSIDFEAFDL